MAELHSSKVRHHETMDETNIPPPRGVIVVYRKEEIGRVLEGEHAGIGGAEAALALVGRTWDARTYDGRGHHESFEFELDDHTFTVSVKPN